MSPPRHCERVTGEIFLSFGDCQPVIEAARKVALSPRQPIIFLPLKSISSNHVECEGCFSGGGFSGSPPPAAGKACAKGRASFTVRGPRLTLTRLQNGPNETLNRA
eukprot:6189885-Pleurochrysis_carterae.AAC.1